MAFYTLYVSNKEWNALVLKVAVLYEWQRDTVHGDMATIGGLKQLCIAIKKFYW